MTRVSLLTNVIAVPLADVVADVTGAFAAIEGQLKGDLASLLGELTGLGECPRLID